MNSRIEELLGYRFSTKELAQQALTHPSLGKKRNNQRLEFLGDSVLGLVVAKLLYEMFPEETEGELARRQAALVCGEVLADVALEMKVGEEIDMAASEESAGGRSNPTNLEDAMEALIGAVYLDGGIKAAEALILPRWKVRAERITAPPKDNKTALQEWAQGRGMALPAYEVTEKTGPAHAPEFTVTVVLDNGDAATGVAPSKRAAEQAAAGALLAHIESGENT